MMQKHSIIWLAYIIKGCEVPQDHRKALELWERAGELGSTLTVHQIGCCYSDEVGAEKDMKKTRQCWEHAAIQGYPRSRQSLGVLELNGFDPQRAMKHFMVAAMFGFRPSLDEVQAGFRWNCNKTRFR